MKDQNTRIRDCEIEISKLAKVNKDVLDLPSKMDTLEQNQTALAEELAQTTAQANQNLESLKIVSERTLNNLDSVNDLKESNANRIEEISALEQRTEILESGMSTQASAIMTLDGELDSLLERTQTAEQNISTLESSVLTLQNGALDQAEIVSNLSTQAVQFEERIGALEDVSFDDVTQRIDDAEAEISALKTSQSTLTQNLDEKESTSNKTTTLSSASTHTQYPSAKAVVDYVSANASGGTGGGTGGGASGGASAANSDGWGNRGYSVAEIAGLLNDFETETDFCNHAYAKIMFATQSSTGPSAKIYFRQNPIKTRKPHIVLKFFMSPMPADLTTLTCIVSLNNVSIGSFVLDVLTDQPHVAELDLDINPATHDIVMFNTLSISFNDALLENTFLDYVAVDIYNSKNCIILNRCTDMDFYFHQSASSWRNFASTYDGGGVFSYYGTGKSTNIINASTTKTAFKYTSYGDSKMRYSSCILQQNFNLNNNGIFTVTTNYYYHYYITQNNIFYNYPTYTGTSPLGLSKYMTDVLYAKKSLHNGPNNEVDFACITSLNFEPKLVNAHYYNSLSADYFAITLPTLNNETFADIVDFVPVYDFELMARHTAKQTVGYFLHHKSGNILYIPDIHSTYYIKVAKGRQVRAYYSADCLSINVFYELNGVVYQKTLTRNEKTSTEWTLSDIVSRKHNIEEYIPTCVYNLYIRNHKLKQC